MTHRGPCQPLPFCDSVMPNELPGGRRSISSQATWDHSQPGDLATGFGLGFQSVPLERGQTAVRRDEQLLPPKAAPSHHLFPVRDQAPLGLLTPGSIIAATALPPRLALQKEEKVHL